MRMYHPIVVSFDSFDSFNDYKDSIDDLTMFDEYFAISVVKEQSRFYISINMRIPIYISFILSILTSITADRDTHHQNSSEAIVSRHIEKNTDSNHTSNDLSNHQLIQDDTVSADIVPVMNSTTLFECVWPGCLKYFGYKRMLDRHSIRTIS